MRNGKWMLLAGIAAAGIATIGAGTARSPADTPPEATYYVDATTYTKFMGVGADYDLKLRLGSRLPATGGPAKGDHFMPEVARVGKSVPLVASERSIEDNDDSFERPKGRMLMYWGCGAHAGPGQPAIFEFNKVGREKTPPNFITTNVPMEVGPTPKNSRSYAEWPNGKESKQINGQSSLLGAHRVASNFASEISFGLDQDFMGKLQVSTAKAADGSGTMSWSALPNATGYYAWMLGGDDGDMVIWVSSNGRDFGSGLMDWLSPATVRRLIGQKIVLPTTQTSCTIPAEVMKATGGSGMGSLHAYGPEANFAFPAKPKDSKIAWHPKWAAKVRYRSVARVTFDSDRRARRGGDDDNGSPADKPAEVKKKCKPSIGGLLKRAAGVGDC